MAKRRPPSLVRRAGTALWGWGWQVVALVGVSVGASGWYSANVYRAIAIEAIQTAQDSIELGEVVKSAKDQCDEEHADVTGLMLLYEGGKLKRVKGLCFSRDDERGLDAKQ